MIFNKKQSFLESFFSLLAPVTCVACGNNLLKHEKMICTSCLYNLPRTNFHRTKENTVQQIFWGRVQIEEASSYFFFQKKSVFQNIIHQLKYHGNREVGRIMGQLYAKELKEAHYFSDVDYVVPVPLHPKRLHERGYNQSEYFARGLAEILKLPLISDNLLRKIYTQTQTQKNKENRWENVKNAFTLKNTEQFANKHILLVDDVLTTGATLEACAAAILLADNAKVSIATIALAQGS